MPLQHPLQDSSENPPSGDLMRSELAYPQPKLQPKHSHADEEKIEDQRSFLTTLEQSWFLVSKQALHAKKQRIEVQFS